MTIRTTPPAPLTCHPYYLDKSWVQEKWLTADDVTYVVRMPLPSPIILYEWIGEGESPNMNERILTERKIQGISPQINDSFTINETIIDELILTKHKSQGLAPYVGDPFVYRWYYAEDNLGRTVAGESWIEYLRD
jgi:hypothetical protein